MPQADRWIVITLLGGFECMVDDEAESLALGAQRLLAFLALESAGSHRGHLARRLWPHSTEPRAAANLRSALWQVRRSRAAPALRSVGPRLRLDDDVTVDVHAVAGTAGPDRPGGSGGLGEQMRRLRRDLLPGWDDDWLDPERERWNSTRLHTLETLAAGLLRDGAFHAAHDAALAALALEPIRETAHRLVVEIHLEEGNPASALQHYRRYRALLHGELGVTPSPLMECLIRPLVLDEQGPAPFRDGRPAVDRVPRPRRGAGG